MSAQANGTGPKKIKALLLEGVSKTGVKLLEEAGFEVEYHLKALPTDTLKQKIKDAHIVGIRSKTLLTADVLKEAANLRVIGCFCIGTNQVDLKYAAANGIAVFNSPFSNSRSVAELVIAEVIALARGVADLNTQLHKGVWTKGRIPGYEIKGKQLGIVGYGHIGSQLSVLADSMGMTVRYYDILQIMPLGIAQPVSSLQELMSTSDFVTLHVPETPQTKNMISAEELSWMKKGAYFINASRGTVVDLDALAAALKSGHIAGAAVDVYPVEPFTNGKNFDSILRGCPNTILTPHIGGSTEEAQTAIGGEVGSALVRFIKTGSTLGAVNFPEVELKKAPKSSTGGRTVRITNVHQNVPGVLRQINRLLSEYNIEKQICESKEAIGYLIADISLDGDVNTDALAKSIEDMKENISTRVF
ncbi:hypothetical protein DFJ73DRAFT_850773 [Zopfochytrium polystomum]|nr:hypothetical protein DFJ73DRAFT_850773 [Zopfochytrium polystomum]